MRTLVILALGALAARADDGLDRALARLRTAPFAARADAVRAVEALEPAVPDVVARLKAGFTVDPIGPGWHVLLARDETDAARPFQLFVPARDAPAPMPLLVHLHGGVSRPDFAYAPRQVGYGRLWVESAERAGFAVAFPLGRRDCTWWRAEGVAHVRAVIRETKRLLPIDDDAIVGTGFSDGGSGCFHLAMAAPWLFAAFIPMNGHPAVAARASGEQLYLRNLKRTPLFVTMTRDDALYPAASVLEHLDLALDAGASLRIVSWEGGNHRPVYFEDLRKSFERFVSEAARDALPTKIDWWCATPATGRVAWVEVLELGAAVGDADAEPDLNVVSKPGRVRLGVQVNRAFAGPGVQVTEVVPDTPAHGMGMAKGDVIVRLDERAIRGLPDLVAALGDKRFGEVVTVVVRRDGREAPLDGRIPPFAPEPYYRRGAPTARVSVRVEGNTIRITSRHVRRLRLLLSPDLFGDAPVEVLANGRRAGAEQRELSQKEILERYAREADGRRIFTRALILSLPPA